MALNQEDCSLQYTITVRDTPIKMNNYNITSLGLS